MRSPPHCPPVPLALATQPKGPLRHYFVEGVKRGERNTLADTDHRSLLPARRRDWQESTIQLRILRRRHGHHIPAALFGFIKALVRDFEQLAGR